MVRIPLPKRPVSAAINLAVERSLKIQTPVVAGYVSAVRRRHPDADPAQVVDLLGKQYLAAVTAAGAAVGGTAAAPAVGTLAALGLGAGEIAAFVEASAFYALAVAEVHGVHIDDHERRRALVMAVLAGESGALIMEKATGRSDAAWARLLPDRVPRPVVEQVNKQLGKWALRRFGAKQGAAAFGRLAPFGVGAVIGGTANAALGRQILSSVRQAFGPPPAQFAGPAAPARRTVRGELLPDRE